MNFRNTFEGHIGDLILLFAFVISVLAFVVVFLITKQESTLLGTIAAAMGGALGAYMQKRATSSSVTNVETIENVETAEAATAKTEDKTVSLDAL